jgi:hypothetical protein
MMRFPLADLLDEQECYAYLVRTSPRWSALSYGASFAP